MNVHSLGQLVMLAPASPRTLALIPPSNQALNQMVSQPFIVNLVYNSRTSCHHPQEDLLLLLLGAAVQSEQKQVKYNQLIRSWKQYFHTAHCTVWQWDKFQDIVIGIKNLPLDTQHGIVDRIRAVWCTFLFSRRLICCPQVTEDPAIVWNKALNDPGSLGEHQRDDLYTVLVEHTNRLSIHSKSFPKNIAVPAFLPTHKNLRKGNFF